MVKLINVFTIVNYTVRTVKFPSFTTDWPRGWRDLFFNQDKSDFRIKINFLIIWSKCNLRWRFSTLLQMSIVIPTKKSSKKYRHDSPYVDWRLYRIRQMCWIIFPDNTFVETLLLDSFISFYETSQKNNLDSSKKNKKSSSTINKLKDIHKHS